MVLKNETYIRRYKLFYNVMIVPLSKHAILFYLKVSGDRIQRRIHNHTKRPKMSALQM